ncbi:MAG: glycosyltransferase family 2 protein [Hyphomicrobiales bacterium]|nr:glycosyltransferase family 2 protein [Hyphomicrobiales bacterium]
MPTVNVSDRPARVDICLCTFRRPSVARTIAAIGAQASVGADVRLIVADNDDTPSAREVVEAAAAEAKVDLLYLHAPARNISTARNACLEAASAPYLAFLDDDLTPTPEWLASLIDTAVETKADIILGPVHAQYPAGAPAWASVADLHSTAPTILSDRSIVTGYTCNALIRRDAIGDLRFDPRRGRTGGEDTVFFHSLWKRGARFVFAEKAVIDEPVDPARISMRWLLKRSFRNGQTHAQVLRSNGEGRPALLIKALGKVGYCLMVSAVTIPFPARWRRSLVRGALHVGSLSNIMGARDLELY